METFMFVCALFLLSAFVSGEECQKKEMGCGLMLASMPQDRPTTPEETEKYCGALRGYISCIDAVKAECPNADSTTADSMKQSVSMMCGSVSSSDGSGVSNAEDCASKSLKCTSSLMAIGQQEPKNNEDIKKYCGVVEEFLTCIEAVKSECPDTDMTMAETMRKTQGLLCAQTDGCNIPTFMKCFEDSGINAASPPTEEDIKNNKDGICEKIEPVGTCIEAYMTKCEELLGGSAQELGVKMHDVQKFKSMCTGKYETEGETTTREGPSDSATTMKISSLLMFTVTVFLFIWQ